MSELESNEVEDAVDLNRELKLPTKEDNIDAGEKVSVCYLYGFYAYNFGFCCFVIHFFQENEP
jgi:hypothetical protein